METEILSQTEELVRDLPKEGDLKKISEDKLRNFA